MSGRRRVRIRCAKRSYWALSVALLAVGTTAADAQNATWVGGNGGDPGEWVEPNNWTPTTVPSGTATFTNTGVTTIANDAGIVAIGAIDFTANAQAYTINIDNPFIVKSAGVTNSSTNTQTFNVTDGNTLVFQNGSTANNGSGAVSYNNSSFITFENSSNAGNANATITNNDILQFNDVSSAGSANITNNVETDFFSTSTAGSANITNASNGTITFNNNATANAATIGNAGIIDFNNSSNAGTTANITNSGVGATITFNNSSSAGGATITNESGGTTTFNAMTTAGSATITTLSGSSVAFAGNSTGGNAQFITNGTGFVDFSGTSGPTGNHQISAGSIAGSGNYFLGANALTVGGNTTVSGVISDCGTGGTQCARSGATGGSLIKAGTGTLTLAGVNTYTGSTTINSGATLALSGSGSISNSSVVTANGTFDISGVGPGFFSSIKSLAGSGGVYLGDIGLVITAASTEFSGVISDGGNNAGLEISGGTQTLSGVNTYTNTTQIDSGATLALKGVGSIASSLDVAFSGGVGTFDISQTSAGASVGALFSGSTTSRVSLGAQTLTITGGSFFDGVIQDGGIGGGSGGSIAIAAFADQALGGTNTYTGSTTINATGELDLISNGPHNGSIANSSGVADNGLFDISDLGNHGTTPVSTSITSLSGSAGGRVNLGENTLTITNASGTFAGVIADGGNSGGIGGALVINSGTEILTGANTYTGATAINGGTLEIDGSIASSSQTTVANSGTLQGIGTVGNLQVNSGGAFAPGAFGSSNTQMNVQGSLAFQSGAFYVTQVSPSSATFANVTGTASLAGTVIATFSTGSYLTKNYLILQSAGLGGTTFGTLDTLGLPRGATASLSYTADDVFLDLSVSLSATGLNTNQKNVANAINAFFNSGGALPPNFASLVGLSGSPLATALTQLDGEAHADAEKGAFQLMSDFLNLMLDPSSGGGGAAGGGGTGGSGALGFAPERDATLPPEIALAYNSMLTKALPKPQSFDQR
jgi:autotransporter-associated beta strand protein